MTAAPVQPPPHPGFRPPRLPGRSSEVWSSLRSALTSLSHSVSPSLLPFSSSGCLHTAAVGAQLCFAVGQPSANTPASIGERGDDSPSAGHHGHTHPSIHKVDRGQRARTGWARKLVFFICMQVIGNALHQFLTM